MRKTQVPRVKSTVSYLVHLEVAAKRDDAIGLEVLLEHVARARAVTLGVRHDERATPQQRNEEIRALTDNEDPHRPQSPQQSINPMHATRTSTQQHKHRQGTNIKIPKAAQSYLAC